MSNPSALHVVIHGHVQGVFFRAFVAKKASELELNGWVRNLPSGEDVEVQVEGNREKLEKMLDLLKTGPPAAVVDRVIPTWSKYTNKYTHFSVRD
jgi:acylphosphatase